MDTPTKVDVEKIPSPQVVPPPQAYSFAYPTILLLYNILEIPKIFWEEIIHVREFLEIWEGW